MSLKNNGLEILDFLAVSGPLSRMEIFRLFTRDIDWHDVKITIMLLHSEGIIEPLPSVDLGKAKFDLTDAGKKFILEIFPENDYNFTLEV